MMNDFVSMSWVGLFWLGVFSIFELAILGLVLQISRMTSQGKLTGRFIFYLKETRIQFAIRVPIFILYIFALEVSGAALDPNGKTIFDSDTYMYILVAAVCIVVICFFLNVYYTLKRYRAETLKTNTVGTYKRFLFLVLYGICVAIVCAWVSWNHILAMNMSTLL